MIGSNKATKPHRELYGAPCRRAPQVARLGWAFPIRRYPGSRVPFAYFPLGLRRKVNRRRATSGLSTQSKSNAQTDKRSSKTVATSAFYISARSKFRFKPTNPKKSPFQAHSTQPFPIPSAPASRAQPQTEAARRAV